MKNPMKLAAVTGVLVALSGLADRPGVAATAEEQRAQGDAILMQMSEKLKSAQAITFSTTESLERVRRNNEKVKLNLEREIAVRRPDRLWFKTSGDREMELVYDGKNVTLISHKHKVYGQFPAQPTIEETADAITARYDIPLPIADLLSRDPQAVLKSEKTTGGVTGKETLGGVECHVLAYQHPNVDFSIWIPVAGDPLPQKLQIKSKARRGQPTTTVLFKEWNLSPQLNEEMFVAKAPAGYEAIPVIQRERALKQAEAQQGIGGTPSPPQPGQAGQGGTPPTPQPNQQK